MCALSSPRVYTECRCARLRFRMWTKLKPGSGGVLTLYALGPRPLAALPWGYSTGAFTPTLGSHNRTELGFDPGGRSLQAAKWGDLTAL